MLSKRLIVGALLIAGVVTGLWLDELIDGLSTPAAVADLTGRSTYPPGSVMFVVIVPVSFMAARELALMLKRKGITTSSRASCGAALIGLSVSTFVPEQTPGMEAVALVASAAAVVLFASMVFYSRRQTVEGVVAATGGTLLAFVYLGLMFGFLLAMRRHHSAWTVLWVLMVTKSCDIGAYFTGRAIGRHKLIPWLSPGKTKEGLAGGVVVASLAGAGGAWLLGQAGIQRVPSVPLGALAGSLFAVVGQAGDLMASMLKRDAGVKDSGTVLPGMGGLIDVLDSPLLVFPAAYWLLTLGIGAG